QLGNPGPDSGEQLVEPGEPLGALAVLLAHVDVQDGGAGVVAVDRLLDVLLHRHRDVLGEVGGQPFGTVRAGGDHELLLVFGPEGSVDEIHFVLLDSKADGKTMVRRACRRRFPRAPSSGGRARSPSRRSAGWSGCPRSPRCWASSASAPGTRG